MPSVRSDSPVIVDAGVQKGKRIKSLVLGADGVLVAYSGERGEVEEAQVWSFAELKQLHPYINDSDITTR